MWKCTAINREMRRDISRIDHRMDEPAVDLDAWFRRIGYAGPTPGWRTDCGAGQHAAENMISEGVGGHLDQPARVRGHREGQRPSRSNQPSRSTSSSQGRSTPPTTCAANEMPT